MHIRYSLLILPLLLVACSSPDENPDVASTTLTPEFRMTLPEGWVEQDDAEAEFSAQNEPKNMYLTVLSEQKADFEFDLEEYADKVIDILVENTDGTITSGPTKITVDGFPALRFEVTGASEGVNLVYVNTVIEGDRDYHQLAAFTLQSSFADNKAEMEGLVQGFEIQ